MPEPKKQSSPRKTGLRRSHLRLKLARSVNRTSPVKAFETAKKTPNLKVKTVKPASNKTIKEKKAEKKAAAKTADTKKTTTKVTKKSK
jgi:ribosomal protein L32